MKTNPFKIATLLFLSLLYALSPGLLLGNDQQRNDVYRIGVSYSTIGDLNPNDASAALKAWAAVLPREYEWDLHLDINLDTYSTREIKEHYARNELDGLWLTVSEMLELGIMPDAFFSGDRANDGPEVKYVILTHEQEGISSLTELANGRMLTTADGEKMALADPWLEMLLAGTGSEYHAPTVVDKPSNAIFQVFFQQADAAIVTTETFELACELNPQLRKKLKILAESPPFITSVFVFRPSLSDDPRMEEIEKALLSVHETVGGTQLLNIIKSDKMGKYPASVLDGTLRFLEEYKQVVKHPVITE